MNQQTYRNILSGQARGFGAALARLSLRGLSWPYGAVVRVRNGLYSRGWLATHAAEAPVISVGNLTAGGTGKTPLVAWLAQFLRDRHIHPAILTRGYKTQKDAPSDEPAELAAMCPQVPVVIDPDRVAGAAEAVRNHGAQVLLLDDGFQHRRLARDLDILTVDATLPFGYGRLLPAGLLREPLAGLARAHAVVLTRCDLVTDDQRLRIEKRLRRIHRELVIAASVHAPVGARMDQGDDIDLRELRNKKVLAFCGIGNPKAFFDTLQRLGCVLVGSLGFDDHYHYTERCLREIHEKAKQCGAELVATTQKDWTKIAPLPRPTQEPRFACLTVKLELRQGAAEFAVLIERALADRIQVLQRSGRQEASRSDDGKCTNNCSKR
ncbi:MAG: tetraacyldisaccharide 4'-kinase [Sedimentisphaerales bacterium]|nr:tetraacyldisaccharide 4'-kinase [Sedimentisphaerales bacterium]